MTSISSPVEQRLKHFVGPRRLGTGAVLSRGRPTEFIDAFDRELARRRQGEGIRMLLEHANVSLSVVEFILVRVVVALLVGAVIAVLLVHRLGSLGFVVVAVSGGVSDKP